MSFYQTKKPKSLLGDISIGNIYFLYNYYIPCLCKIKDDGEGDEGSVAGSDHAADPLVRVKQRKKKQVTC